MANLSDLPPIGGDAVEPDPIDFDKYQPASETPLPLPVSNYLLRLVDGQFVKKSEDDEVEGVFPILFDLTENGFLKATYAVEVVGRIIRNPDRTEMVTEDFRGRQLRFQRVNRAPFMKGQRKGCDMMADMLYGFGFEGVLNGVTRAERNQSYADALEQCIGRVAKGYVIRRRSIDTGKVVDGSRIYKEFKNDAFDQQGEMEFAGQTYKAYNEVSGFYRWHESRDVESDIPF